MGPSILPQPFEIRILKLCFSHMQLAQAPGRRDRNKKQLQVSGGWWERWGRRQCSVWVQDQGLRHCDSVISSSSDTVWVSHLQSHYYVLVIYIVIYTCVYIHTHVVYSLCTIYMYTYTYKWYTCYPIFRRVSEICNCTFFVTKLLCTGWKT